MRSAIYMSLNLVPRNADYRILARKGISRLTFIHAITFEIINYTIKKCKKYLFLAPIAAVCFKYPFLPAV